MCGTFPVVATVLAFGFILLSSPHASSLDCLRLSPFFVSAWFAPPTGFAAEEAS